MSPEGSKGQGPGTEVFSNAWKEPIVKDDLATNGKKRILPGTIAKQNTAPSMMANSFRPPSSIGEPRKSVPYGGYGEEAYRPKRKAEANPVTDDVALSSSQKKVLDTIMSRKSVFFTGAAGTGKSYIIKVLRDVLDGLGFADKISFTAPTGVAACNIRGLTIHAWAGVGK